jgi:hypothetical protein
MHGQDAPDGADPMPVPPREPRPEECCQRGCEPCVFDRYYDALEHYQEAVEAWLKRHPGSLP